MEIKRMFLVVAFASLSSTLLPSAKAIQIIGDDPVNGTFDVTRHERYYQGVDKDFLGANLKLSGVSHNFTSGYGTPWATMISDTYFLSSSHYKPLVNHQVKFYQDDSLSSTSWTGTVSGGASISGTDLWLGQLQSAPPSWVYRYPILKRQSVNYTAIPGVETSLYVVGDRHSPNPAPDPSIGSQVIRVGRNRVEDIGFIATNTHGWEVLAYGFDADAEFQDDEAITQSGDSGGPSFTELPGLGPVLTGLHAGPSGNFYYDMDISQFADLIVSSVPETVVVMTDLLGDIDGDFKVDIEDYGGLSANFNTGPGKTYNQGDLNLDGYVNINDFGGLSANMGEDILADPDFNLDGLVNGDDFAEIAAHWMQSVAEEGEDGDADSSGFVDRDDIEVFDAWWLKRVIERPEPLVRVPGDANNDGSTNNLDATMITLNQGQTVAPYTGGDVTGDGYVSFIDFTLCSQHLNETFADTTGDGLTDFADLDELVANFGPTAGGRAVGDLDEDGMVDEEDLAAMGDWWRHSYDEIILTSPIPEPSSVYLSWAAILGLILVRGRTRRVARYAVNPLSLMNWS